MKLAPIISYGFITSPEKVLNLLLVYVSESNLRFIVLCISMFTTAVSTSILIYIPLILASTTNSRFLDIDQL